MIELPDFSKSFEYENNFYLSSQNSRSGKFLAHYELFKMSKDISGHIVECGVYKGASFVRFAAFRDLYEQSFLKKMVGFDTFGKFPKTNYKKDKKPREDFIQDSGEESISKAQLSEVLKHKNIANFELVEGDIVKTVPEHIKNNPDLKISLLNLDTDIYEPAVVILEHFWPRISKGGILILDDYHIFPGETKAVDDFFKGQDIKIKKFSFSKTPCYIKK